MIAKANIVLRPGLGTSTVEVNGVDLSAACIGVAVVRDAKELNSVITLHLRADVEIDAELAQVVVVQPGVAPVDALREMISGADPGALETAALEKMSSLAGGHLTTGQAFLAVLEDWAGEA